MGIIATLPESVQNKIAAGEVIERPASCIKELAENSMDAGATMVEIEIEEGGRTYIRVSDNGCGMDEEDVVACMQRHATSKIRHAEDIFHISTYGFRGEALPSIGSVSRLTIVTGTDQNAEGRELVVEGGRSVRLAPAAPRRGTTIEVRDIFYNVPARRKFLRQPAAESARVADVVTRLALGSPKTGFRLISNGRMTVAVNPAPDLRTRISDLFGRQIGDALAPFGADITDGLSVHGFFARPPHRCANSRDIYILANNRWIRSYALARAVTDAFGGILPPRTYPFMVICLDVDPERVDVNVHPTKEEVRFEQERLIFGGVRHAVQNALQDVGALTAASAFAAAPATPQTTEEQQELPLPSSFAARPDAARPAARRHADLASSNRPFAHADMDALRTRVRSVDTMPLPPASPPEPAPQSDGVRVHQPGCHRVIGQAGGRYILIDGPEGLLLVDPHALHERQNYDKLCAARGDAGPTRQLLLPLELDLTPTERETAVEAVPELRQNGFDCTLDDNGRLIVRAAPAFVQPAAIENLLRQVLADAGSAEEAMREMRTRVLASLACRMSVLQGHTLPEEEILTLLDDFFNAGRLPTCPHGRPTAVRIRWEELDRRFGR